MYVNYNLIVYKLKFKKKNRHTHVTQLAAAELVAVVCALLKLHYHKKHLRRSRGLNNNFFSAFFLHFCVLPTNIVLYTQNNALWSNIKSLFCAKLLKTN